MRSLKLKGVDIKLTVVLVEHSLWQEGHLGGHQDSDLYH